MVPPGISASEPPEKFETRLCAIFREMKAIKDYTVIFRKIAYTDSSDDTFTPEKINSICGRLTTKGYTKSRRPETGGPGAPEPDAIHVSQWVTFTSSAQEKVFEEKLGISSDP